MKKIQEFDDHHCSQIEKKHHKLDIAYCNATYDSKEALNTCYEHANETSMKREQACRFS